MIKLSVIIPVYNEENRLPKTLKAVDEYLRTQSYKYEILVVNAGSTDRTKELVETAMREMQNLSILNRKNRGKGYAVREGMLAARGQYRMFMDADNSTSIDQVSKMWPEFEKGADVVIGSRDIKDAQIAVSQPLWRQTLGNVFNLIVQTLSGLWGMWDTQCGFKGFSAAAAQEIFARCTIDQWAFDVEVLVIAKKSGYKIKEIPVTWINDKESKVRLKGMVKMLLEVLQISINNLMGKY
ncbi:MAG TPA: dolichyl-phosphate beta-glucosyltransferase [Candidatus Paceibacterota bacterium]